MEAVLGSDPRVFVGVTVVLMGGAGWLTGQALARTWRPVGQLIPYVLLLGCGDRFLIFALFEGDLLNAVGYVFDTAVIAAFATVAFRITQAAKMVDQYPWLYERRGPLGWREKS